MAGQYSNGVVIFYDESAVATNLGGITNIDIPTNAEIVSDDGGGIYDQSLSITNYAPVANVTTKSIKTVLQQIALDGQCVLPSPEPVTRVDVIGRALKTCQESLSENPNIRYRVDRGLLRLNALTADRGQDVTLSFILDTLTDGTNEPVGITDGVAMPASVVAEQYTLGLCRIGNVLMPEIEGISIDFQVTTTEKTPQLASIWPDSIGVIKVRPMLSFRGRDLSRVKATLLEQAGTAGTHVNTIIQLVKRKNNGSFELAASGLHIALTMNGLIVPENLMSASGTSRATNTIKMQCSFDGTNVPLVGNLSANYDTTP